MTEVKLGQRLPNVRLAEIVGVDLKTIDTDSLLAGKRSIIIGLPGAFTPICSEKHLPQFVLAADSLLAAGFNLICCILPNDPWVVQRFAQHADPRRKLRFLSDGNLEFARATGLLVQADDYFMGQRSARYLMTVNNAVVERLNVEPTAISMSCTNVRDVVEL